MKFTLSWLKDHLETDATLDEIVEALTRSASRSSGSRTAAALKGFVVGHVIEAEAASQCRPPARLQGRCRRRAGAGRLRRAQRAHRHEERVLAARHVHSRQGSRWRRATSAASNRNGMMCSAVSWSCRRITTASSSCPPTRRSARLRRICRARRSGDRHQGHAEPRRCLGVRGIARDLAAAGLGALKTPGFTGLYGDMIPIASFRASNSNYAIGIMSP